MNRFFGPPSFGVRSCPHKKDFAKSTVYKLSGLTSVTVSGSEAQGSIGLVHKEARTHEIVTIGDINRSSHASKSNHVIYLSTRVESRAEAMWRRSSMEMRCEWTKRCGSSGK